jgi:hypothetical protein
MPSLRGVDMSFRVTALITAIVTSVLGVGYLAAGRILVGRWQIEPTGSVLLFGRRIGALYLGLAVMFFLARSAVASAERTALCSGAAVTCSLLAFLGLFEFSAGRAGAGILASVAVEFLLAVAYIRILVAERKRE